MNRNGLAALLLIGVSVSTCIWLHQRATTIFPRTAEFNVGTPDQFAWLGTAGVVGITLVWLWAVRSGRSPDAREKAVLGTLLVVGAVVALAWLHFHSRFDPHRSAQFKEVGTWVIAVLTVALLFRLLKKSRSSRPRPPLPPNDGMENNNEYFGPRE